MPAQQEERIAKLATTARNNLAARARSIDELRDLGLMLGLIEVDPDGSLVAACPWDVADGPDQRSPQE